MNGRIYSSSACQAVSSEHYLAQTLQPKAADPNQIEAGGLHLTPLFYTLNTAGRMGHFPNLKLLVEAGAEVRQRSGDGAIPLLSAAAAMRYDMVDYLLEHGADPGAFENKSRDLAFYIRYHDKTFRKDAEQRFWLEMVEQRLGASNSAEESERQNFGPE